MSFSDFIAALTKEDLQEIIAAFNKLNGKLPTYTFSKITYQDLKGLFKIERIFDNDDAFDAWFNFDITIKDADILFLVELLNQEANLLRIYNEEDLKVHFIAPILNRVNFKSLPKKIRDFYEETLIYKTDRFILGGIADFIVARGLEYPEEHYFFVQEFKKGMQYSNPEPQLLAELISAVEINNSSRMEGAFIVGENWNFVILRKHALDTYQYFISRTFNATYINDLRDIYKNLLFIKYKLIP